MTQSQITTITRTIDSRIREIANARFPAASERIDGNTEITKALVHGKSVQLRSAAAIKQTALNKIAEGGYSSNRTFSFSEIFETSKQVEIAAREARLVDRKRDRLVLKLGAVKSRVIADCKLGRFDTESGAALDVFEEKAELIAAGAI
jgi:hypothetical protein